MKQGYFKKEIYYDYYMPPAGSLVLVFIHGLSGSLSAWNFYRSRFAGKYGMLFFDMRGHGKSIKKNDFEYYSLKGSAKDIYDLANFLKIPNLVLISHSFGSFVALEFAAMYGKMLKGSVFLAPDYRIGKTFRARIAAPVIEASRIFTNGKIKNNSGCHFDYSRLGRTGDWDPRRIYADVKNTTPKVYFYFLRQARNFDGKEILNKIKTPSLIIHGARDTVFPIADSIKMAELLPGARLKIIPLANHLLLMNNPDEISREVDSFVENLSF